MLVLGIFSLMTAVALLNVNISPLLLTRVIFIVLLYVTALSYNAFDIQAIGSDVSIYNELYQVLLIAYQYSTNTLFQICYYIVQLVYKVLWQLGALYMYMNDSNFMELIFDCYKPLLIHITMLYCVDDCLQMSEILLPIVVKQTLSDDSHTSTNYIPWTNTTSMKKGVEALNRMYTSLDVGSPLKDYIDGNCSHLLDDLKGYTPIPIHMVDVKYLVNDAATITLKNDHTARYTRHLVNKTGIYVFLRPEDDCISYCGSSLNYVNRIRGHYLDMQRFNKPFYTDVLDSHGGFSGYLWNPIYQSTNYAEDYISVVKHMSPADKVILDSFTRQEIRSLEQAVSTYAKPIYYKGYSVSMSHANWYKGYVPVSSVYSMSTTWVTENGSVYNEDSLAKASKALGLYVARIKQVANCIEDTYVDSPNFGKVQIYVKGLPNIERPKPWTSGSKPDIQGVDMSNLEPNKIYLLDSDKQLLPHGPYNTSFDANAALGLPAKTASRHWVNKDYLVEAPLLNISVYLVNNKVSKMMPGVVTNLVTGVKSNFPSMNSAITFVDPGMDFSSFIHKFVLKGKPFIDGDNAYLVEYERLEDHLRKEQMVTDMIKKSKVKSNAKYYAKIKEAKITEDASNR